jgi:hypothetical protein
MNVLYNVRYDKIVSIRSSLLYEEFYAYMLVPCSGCDQTYWHVARARYLAKSHSIKATSNLKYPRYGMGTLPYLSNYRPFRLTVSRYGIFHPIDQLQFVFPPTQKTAPSSHIIDEHGKGTYAAPL